MAKKSELIKEWTTGDWNFTSKSRKSDNIGRIKLNLKIIDLEIPMRSSSNLIGELNDAINKVLTKHHDAQVDKS